MGVDAVRAARLIQMRRGLCLSLALDRWRKDLARNHWRNRFSMSNLSTNSCNQALIGPIAQKKRPILACIEQASSTG